MKHRPTTSLRTLNTFGVTANAAAVLDIETPDELDQVEFSPGTDLVLGGGSNVLLVEDLPGTVYLNRIRGRRILEQDEEQALIELGGGENWHESVLWTLDQGLCGLENLSLIPGCVGAAPMQNIGAYGVELSSVLESLTAWDWQKGEWRQFSNADCRFAYRDSHFKSAQPGHFLITAIRLRLSKVFSAQLDYAGIGEELQAMDIGDPDAHQVSDAVIRIRRRRLPDPARLGNAGSFFKNPVVDKALASELTGRYAGLPAHPVQAGGFKLSAAWMLEHCGWKGHRSGAAGFSDQHALVLVNHGNASGHELLELARQAAASVAEEFDIHLEAEPRIIGRVEHTL